MKQSPRVKILCGIIGLLIFIVLTALGQFVQRLLHLPLPGPVIGFTALAIAIVIARRSMRGTHQVVTYLEPIAKVLLNNMGLLFVPAGVGIITQGELIRREWLAISTAVIGSTILGLAATGWVMQRYSGNDARGHR